MPLTSLTRLAKALEKYRHFGSKTEGRHFLPMLLYAAKFRRVAEERCD